MTTITRNTWCRRCGIEVAATRDVILAGAWRLCPDCREAPPPPGPPPPRTENPGVQC